MIRKALPLTAIFSRKIVLGLSGEKTVGSKVIVSPGLATNIAWRRVPGPLSATLVTTIVFPFGIGVIVGVGSTSVSVGGINVGVSATGVAAGDGLGSQPFKASVRMVARRNRKLVLLIVPLH